MKIKLSKILYDEEYKYSSYTDNSLLLNSIKEIGLLDPIHLFQENNIYRILSGHNRYKVFEELGLDQIDAEIYNLEEYDLLYNINLRQYNNTLTNHNKIKLINYLNKTGDLNKPNLKILNIPDYIYQEIHFINYFKLPDTILNFIKTKNPNFKIIESILDLNQQFLPILNEIISKQTTKVNIIREILVHFSEISRIFDNSEVIKKDIFPIIENGNLDDLMHHLKQVRYPNYIELIEKSKNIIDSLNGNYDFEFPDYFEGNSFKISCSIKKLSDFKKFQEDINKIEPYKISDLLKLF